MNIKASVFEEICALYDDLGKEECWRSIVYEIWPLVLKYGDGANFYELQRQMEY